MKKVLILTADKTGTGHKSSANAIEKQLRERGFDVRQEDSFLTMGKFGEKLEDAYIPCTTKHPYIWKLAHKLSDIFPCVLHTLMYIHCKKQMTAIIDDYRPDLIISVHGMFTRAVSKILKKKKLNIPFCINVIDLVNPPHIWRDKRATISFLPTEKIKESYLSLGFKEEQLVVSGFPIRESIHRRETPKTVDGKVKLLMINPSLRKKKSVRFVLEAAKIKNSALTVVCGLDEKLHDELLKEKQINPLLRDVEILGFTNKINELLESAHIVMTKAGPNMLLESTRSGSAVIVTGHIPGQEAHNHLYITENGYGLRCENPKKLVAVTEEFIENGGLEKALSATLKSDCNDGAAIIADNIQKLLTENNDGKTA